jgi:hypothetical protein
MRLIMLIYNTSFTSAAFARSSSPEEIKLVQTWPNCGTSDPESNQVSTELHYANPEKLENIWGYGIPKSTINSVEPLKWFKLLLQNRDISESTTKPPPPTKQPDMAHGSSMSFADSLISVFRDLSFSFGSASLFTQKITTPKHSTEKRMQELGIEAVKVVTDFLSHVREATAESMSEHTERSSLKTQRSSMC